MNFAGDAKKAWKDIWGCGQGIGAIKAVVPAAELVARLAREYDAARAKFAPRALDPSPHESHGRVLQSFVT